MSTPDPLTLFLHPDQYDDLRAEVVGDPWLPPHTDAELAAGADPDFADLERLLAEARDP